MFRIEVEKFPSTRAKNKFDSIKKVYFLGINILTKNTEHLHERYQSNNNIPRMRYPPSPPLPKRKN